MTNLLRPLALGFGALALWAVPMLAQNQPELKVGDQAPNFTLPGTDGKTYTLSQMKGHWVVLAWFPKAFTAG